MVCQMVFYSRLFLIGFSVFCAIFSNRVAIVFVQESIESQFGTILSMLSLMCETSFKSICLIKFSFASFVHLYFIWFSCALSLVFELLDMSVFCTSSDQDNNE